MGFHRKAGAITVGSLKYRYRQRPFLEEKKHIVAKIGSLRPQQHVPVLKPAELKSVQCR